jgi:hypothetical protein
VRLPPEIRLVNVPEAVPGGTETGIWISHDPNFVEVAAGIIPPVRVIEFDVIVTVPPQVLVAFPAVTNGVGRISENVAPSYIVSVGLRRVMIKLEVCPTEKFGGENLLPKPIARTSKRELAGERLVSPCSVWSAFAGMVLL